MGLIKAIAGATGGVLADQWLEFFSCDSIPANTLVVRGHKKVSSRSSNTTASENVISNGSKIAVAVGQCMIITEQGKVVDLCAEPGEYTYDSSTEPSLFYGDLGQNIVDSFKNIGKRFTFGGEPPKDQRVYFVNTKELLGNKYGTPQSVPFRVIDERAGIDMDVNITCFGEYSYHICDPVLFFSNVCSNVPEAYTRDQIDGQLRTELLTVLQRAFSRISISGIRYSQLPAHTEALTEILNEELTNKWRNLRGIEIVSFGMSSVKASEEDEATIKEMQKAATYMDPAARAGLGAVATAKAMQDAAKNEGGMGAMGGFIGMGMGSMVGNSFGMGSDVGRQPMAVGATMNSGIQGGAPAAANPDAWTCSCGSVNTGRFCPECGSPKPEPPEQWTCSCGSVNTGKFCAECGSKKPAAVKYQCDKCGWVPDNPANPPKFCEQCGDPIDANDIVQ